jgi:hypothetical protein
MHTGPENYRKTFASAIDDEQSGLFNAAPIRRALVYDFDFKHEVLPALDFELRDNSGNATLSKQELENKNHQCALKRVDYPKTAKFHLVKVKVYDKSGYGHDETLLEDSDDDTSFGMASVKKVEHDTSKWSLRYLSLHFSGPGEIGHSDCVPPGIPPVVHDIVHAGNKFLLFQ